MKHILKDRTIKNSTNYTKQNDGVVNDNVNHKTVEAYLKLVIVLKMTISEKGYLSRKYNATLSTPIKC